MSFIGSTASNRGAVQSASIVAVRQRAGHLRGGDEPLPHRPAQAGDQQLPLQRLHPPAELQQSGADRGVVDLAEVAGQQLVGEADAGGDRVQLHPHVLGVAAAGGGRGELHVLAGRQVLDHAGLEGLDPAAVGVGRGLAERLLVVRAGDEGGEAGLDLLPHQLGVVVLVEIAQLQDHRREPRHAAHLPRPQPVEQVQHRSTPAPAGWSATPGGTSPPRRDAPG